MSELPRASAAPPASEQVPLRFKQTGSLPWKWSKREQSIGEQERNALLLQLGQDFKQVRQARGLSLEELHAKTWVPLHQLKALESGCLNQLPEDIYVRGFIKRIATALNLDGAEIVATIPVPATAKAVVPSWHQSLGTNRSLTPVHLCVGYAALMATAVGGLAWMTNQPTPDTSNYSSPSPASPVEASQHHKLDATDAKLSQATTTQPDIIPPEYLPF